MTAAERAALDWAVGEVITRRPERAVPPPGFVPDSVVMPASWGELIAVVVHGGPTARTCDLFTAVPRWNSWPVCVALGESPAFLDTFDHPGWDEASEATLFPSEGSQVFLPPAAWLAEMADFPVGDVGVVLGVYDMLISDEVGSVRYAPWSNTRLFTLPDAVLEQSGELFAIARSLVPSQRTATSDLVES